MATRNHPDETIAKAHQMRADGENTSAIARQLRIPRSTVKNWFEDTTRPAPPVKQSDMRDMQIAALESQLRQLRSGQEPLVTPLWQENTDLATLWKAAEVENEQKIAKALQMAHFTAKLPDEPCAVSFVSDQHISIGNTVDLKRMKQDAELIAETPGAYAVLGGDGADNHIKHRAAILAARSQPSDQWKLFDYYLSIFASKILAMVSGNHDDWTTEIAGIDIVNMLAQRQKICFAPDEARIETHVGSQVYKLAVRHQYRMNSSFNLGHAVKQWYRMGAEVFDIGCVCHHHDPHVETFTGHGEKNWACRPGSYQVTSAYSRRYGFNAASPTCPTFILYPDRREIIGFEDLRPALRMLRAER